MRPVVLSLVLLLVPQLASAQLEDPRLRALQARAVPYGRSSVEVLAELDVLAREGSRARDLDLARYLRAVIATDLWIVARRNRDAVLTSELARAHRVAPDALSSTLERALQTVRFGPYVSEVDDALAALRGTAPRGSVRGDLLYADRVMRALGAHAPVPAVAALADDPCADREADCPEALRPFDAEGRRAIRAVLDARRGAELVLERATLGDPLAQATAGALEIDRALLAMTELAPEVVGFTRLGALSPIEGPGARGGVDVVVHVDSHELRYAFAPRVAFDADGARLVGARGPLLPAFATLPLPESQRAFPEAIPELVELLRSLEDARVAFAPSPTLSTTDLWRVVRSAEAAGTTSRIAGIDREGRVCVRPLEWREESASGAEVYVRLGGYSIHTVGATQDVPRIRHADGWSYDAAALRTLVGEAPVVSVRAMHDMPVAAVVDALFSADRTLLVRR